MNRNNILDISKTLACIGVITLHSMCYVNPFLKDYISFLLCSAVPFFFMISGYYMHNTPVQKLDKQIIKLLKLYLVGFIAYIPLTLIRSNQDVISFFSIENLFKILFLNYTPWNGTLWYIAAIVTILLLKRYIFININDRFLYNINFVYILISSLIVLTDSIQYLHISKYNYLIQGLPCFLWGQYFAEKRSNFLRTKVKLFFIIVTVSIIIINLMLGMYGYDISIYTSNFTSLIISTCVFIISFTYVIDTKFTNFLSLCGCKYSGYIYVFHFLFVLYAHGISIRLGIENIFLTIPVIMTFLYTLLLVLIIYPILKKIGV